MNDKIKLLIAEDHSIVRDGIMAILENSGKVEVIAEAKNGVEAVDKFFKFYPDVLLLDISMPELNGLEALKRIKRFYYTVKALFLTMYGSEEYIYAAYKTGAKGLITKNSVKEELLLALEQIYNGGLYFGEKYDKKSLDNLLLRFDNLTLEKFDLEFSLTPAERKVLMFINEGLTSQEMAERLNLSKRTIDTYRRSIMNKLGIKSLPELIKTAVKFANLKNTMPER